ncbi:MAG: hypothetical protein U5L72_04280 [Bacteroidales bacterium]|nr:hypothetical protein [Bacteroidales bacterium]
MLLAQYHSILLGTIRVTAKRQPAHSTISSVAILLARFREDKIIDRYSIFYGKEYIYVR